MTTAVARDQQSESDVSPDDNWILNRAREILRREAAAIEDACEKLDSAFTQAIRLILACKGRVAIAGVGKAGDIGKKIQSTMASTGTPAYVLHPVEALHGDLGMIRPDDVAIMLSKSGTTEELVRLIPAVSKIGCKVILLTASRQSQCAKLADIVIGIGDTPEACPLGMAPSSSTAAMLAVGDALALTLMDITDVGPEQYAAYHPGGALGRSLMLVHEIMRTGPNCPTVHRDATLQDYDRVVRQAPLRAGAAVVVDDENRLVGFFTHGDLSRLLGEPDHPAKRRLSDVMTASPKVVNMNDKVADALALMQPHGIDEIPVVDDDHRVVGMIDIQDLLTRGFSVFDEG